MSTCLAVCLHALGASGAEFDDVAARVGDDVELLALDLPGFGSNAATGYTVEQMAEFVVAETRRAVAERRVARWLLVGHSMGGKIATVLAARALDGEPGLFGFAGAVLLAGSPPSPEPMDDEQRETMIGWAADGPLDAGAARSFVDGNVGAALPAGLDALALADLQRCSREAWLAWLERGSREDWGDTIGTLDVPAVIVAGGDDGPLGESGQRRLNAPVYPRARVVTLPGAGHLLPLERPAEVAETIMTFWRDDAGRGPAVPPAWARTIATNRASARTRGILAGRAFADDPRREPVALNNVQLATLRLLADLVVPQDGPAVDLAARIDAQLAAGEGDGWRPDALPPDKEAYRAGLDALSDLSTLTAGERAVRVQAIVDGEFDPPGELSAEQLSLWFEDARTDLVRQWLAHPATAARIGFDGYLNGGDGERLAGWQLLAAGERESWEPAIP